MKLKLKRKQLIRLKLGMFTAGIILIGFNFIYIIHKSFAGELCWYSGLLFVLVSYMLWNSMLRFFEKKKKVKNVC